MIQQFFKIGGVKNEKDFLAKYPTEDSFFRQHPEAMSLVEQSMPYMPSYSDMVMPQAMYGMGMAYGGYVPYAANGMQVTDPPRQQDYPDYESYAAAMDEYIASLQQQADTGQTMPQGAMNAAPTSSAPVSAPSPYVPTNKFNLKNYKGVSIVDFLAAQGKPTDFASRKELAAAMGISNYRGTASQNTQMLKMLQQSPDALSDYNGVSQPTANVTKRASSGKNAKAAPTTEELANAKTYKQNPYDYMAASLLTPEGGVDYTGIPYTDAQRIGRPGYYSYGSGSIFERLPVNQRQPWAGATPRYMGNLAEPWDPQGNTNKKFYAEAFQKFKEQSEQGKTPFVPYSLNSNVAKIYEMALKDWNSQLKKERGGSYTGTWNGNQGFANGGAYVPDYASSAYGLPQYELGAPIYADGGMSPDEAAMMQQQGAAPQQGGGADQQQQIVQAIMQMLQQGMDPNQIIQQLGQAGVPPQMAQQMVMAVVQQVQGGGGAAGGQGGMGGGEPNGAQQPMAPLSPEQGMEGMPMPGGMARGGMVPGWEGEVSMAQLEDLKRRGIKFDII